MRLSATTMGTTTTAVHAIRRVSAFVTYMVTTSAIKKYRTTAAAVWPDGKLAPSRRRSSCTTNGRLRWITLVTARYTVISITRANTTTPTSAHARFTRRNTVRARPTATTVRVSARPEPTQLASVSGPFRCSAKFRTKLTSHEPTAPGTSRWTTRAPIATIVAVTASHPTTATKNAATTGGNACSRSPHHSARPPERATRRSRDPSFEVTSTGSWR